MSQLAARGAQRGRVAVVIFGVVLMLFGAGAVTLLFWATRGASFIVIDTPEIWRDEFRIYRRAAYLAVLSVIFLIGANLVAGRKPTVLFLRRFGLDENLVVSRVIAAGLGRRLRVVTLDDGAFPPLEVPWLERWSIRLVAPVGVAALVGWSFLVIKSLDDFPDPEFGGDLVLETGVMVVFWIKFAAVGLCLAILHLWRVREVSRLVVTTPRELERGLNRVGALQSFTRHLTLMAPRVTVIRVVDSLWRQTVGAMAAQTDLALVDVSAPSVNVLWEIEQLRGAGHTCVFIAEQARWSALRAWPERTGEPARALEGELERRPVLLYDGGDRLGGADFRARLRQALLEAAGERASRRKRRSRRGAWSHRARELALYAVAPLVPFTLGDRFWGGVFYALISRGRGSSLEELMALPEGMGARLEVLAAGLCVFLALTGWSYRTMVRRLQERAFPADSVRPTFTPSVAAWSLAIGTAAYLALGWLLFGTATLIRIPLEFPVTFAPLAPAVLVAARWVRLRRRGADQPSVDVSA